eukprot:gene28219-37224_t
MASHSIESVAAALQYISYYHPADFIAHLARAYEREQSAAARSQHLCRELKRPRAQGDAQLPGQPCARGLAASGIPYMGNILTRMFPPDLSRSEQIFWSLATTFQMAVSGCVLGLILSFPLAILAADGLSPHPVVRVLARGLIAFFRTVPDLIWALFFVIAVGLGPAAGVLALMIDTIGYAGRFFAEAMEETDKGPREALSTIGASKT